MYPGRAFKIFYLIVRIEIRKLEYPSYGLDTRR